MTYNVFGGTLSLTRSINPTVQFHFQLPASIHPCRAAITSPAIPQVDSIREADALIFIAVVI